ncbi:MAG: hypothetical protein A2W82_04165 [Sulfurimonas sp. RIFCSPLOWO2_12_36_12]|uniref:hypothetical protein n=1 Tax=Sulfurimonas sp. RIFCSPLOWO2_12_36_12 TaxID=1802253 RepID=UPI0008B07E02|nr:hypothetical protein [Sulfurimonas sp. RIFCSPLOWO2_12_36_12]OHD98846.1 MAG: hypothetical protein A3J26_00725 [Sulfurimonas sp. RIFCSPLOWO2_02_FULL_36_28]OHE00479.1 MAG: hypothetical protein A2W82_04165 [Sulfurimonas sp. RIFCSPLOWO2_12_36_12]
MMNNGNEISHHTKLYGFIGEYAAQSSMSATLNKLFKAQNKNAMMIPMNIREDDFFFTLSNMKKSHVNGALISNEYVKNALEILDEASEAVKLSGMCDILIRDEQKLIGDIVGMRVLKEFLENKNAKKVALIGVGSRAKAFSFFANGFDISYFYDDLEKLMNFTKEMGAINADINRITEGMDIDLSSYDAVVDFSDFDTLDMISGLSAINIDMKQKKEFSALKVRANEMGAAYIGFDNMLDEISSAVFEFLKNKKHLEHDKSDMKF